MKAILRLFGTLAICAIAFPVAAQNVATTAPASSGVAQDVATTAPASSGGDAGQVIQLPPAGPVPTPEHTGIKALFKDLLDDTKHLPSMTNLFWVGAGAAGALAIHPADNHINEELTDASWSHGTFGAGAVLGQSYTLLGASIAVYSVGRIKGEGKVSHTGMDMLQSLIMSEGMTQVLKYTVRRERPDGSGANGFPSGHAADTFAIATALERHFGWKGAVPAYAIASYVAASRLHDNRHYASDVVFGAAVGIIAGRTVTRHGREFPIVVAGVPGGAAIMYVHQPK